MHVCIFLEKQPTDEGKTERVLGKGKGKQKKVDVLSTLFLWNRFPRISTVGVRTDEEDRYGSKHQKQQQATQNEEHDEERFLTFGIGAFDQFGEKHDGGNIQDELHRTDPKRNDDAERKCKDDGDRFAEVIRTVCEGHEQHGGWEELKEPESDEGQRKQDERRDDHAFLQGPCFDDHLRNGRVRNGVLGGEGNVTRQVGRSRGRLFYGGGLLIGNRRSLLFDGCFACHFFFVSHNLLSFVSFWSIPNFIKKRFFLQDFWFWSEFVM